MEEVIVVIKFQKELWELLRLPGEWRLCKPWVSISFYNFLSLIELKQLLSRIENAKTSKSHDSSVAKDKVL